VDIINSNKLGAILLKNKLLVGSLFGICAALSYATMATAVKLSGDVNVETLVFFRNIISLILLSPLLLRKKITIKTKRLSLHFIRAFFGMLALYSYFYAVKFLPLVNAILLANTNTLFIPLVVLIWLKQRIPLRRALALGLGFFGIGLILQPNLDFPVLPSIIGVSAGLFSAIALTSVRQLSKTEHTESILFYFFVFAILISFFPMVLRWESFDPAMWGYILIIGLFASLFQYFITKSYTYIPATKAGCLMFASVVFGGVYGFIFFKTLPNFLVITGSALVIVGSLIALLDKKEAISLSKKVKKKN